MNSKSRIQGKEKIFWKWFVENTQRILQICDNQEIIGEIASRLGKIYSHFTFEIGETSGGKYEFVISCGGIRDGIPYVEKLASCAPSIENIEIVKFRQPKGCEFAVQIGDLKLSAEEIWFQYCFDEKIHLQLFLPGYSGDDSRYAHLAFLLLDNILGEYFVMTRIGHIDLQPMADNIDRSKLLKLIKLPEILKVMMN